MNIIMEEMGEGVGRKILKRILREERLENVILVIEIIVIEIVEGLGNYIEFMSERRGGS